MGRILATGVALALLLSGQAAAAEPVPAVHTDPLLTFPMDLTKADPVQVAKNREAKSKVRAAALREATPYLEKEPQGTAGANDTLQKAEHIAGFRKKVRITGGLVPDATVPAVPPFAETNDAIGLASDTGITGSRKAIRTSGTIGDGPHGSAGDRTGDFDFYKIRGGALLTAQAVTPQGGLDPMLVLYDADGVIWAINDNTGASTDSLLTAPLPAGRDFYLMVGSGPFGMPRDPKTPGTGPGAITEGPYELRITSGRNATDLDYYSFDLRAGDVLGASLSGGTTRLAVYDPAGREVMGSSQDLTTIFAEDSPLPGGGNAVVDFVAPKNGRYVLGVEAGEGSYDVQLEAYRPGTETTPRGTVQTLFLDFDGARVNTRIYGAGGGIRDISPLTNWLPRWGLTARDERAVIDSVVATVRETMERDMIIKGTNKRFALRVLNSRDHADPWGQPNVSRVVVGGSIAETGIGAVGIAQSIDAGNFGKEETALVMLDVISQPPVHPWTLNSYLKPQSNKTKFIGQAIGNIVAHEAGHMSGSWHQNTFNDVTGIMDPGTHPDVMFGIGPDGVGGTPDDTDTDFIEEEFSPSEGFTGIEDTINRTAWAFVRGTG